MRTIGFPGVLAVLLSACASQSLSQSRDQPAAPLPLAADAAVESISTSQQVVVVRALPGRPTTLCMAPFPDAGGESGHELTLSAGIRAKDAIGSESYRGGVGLGGRSADVLLARELLYRACELATNLGADRELTLKIYDRFLATLESISRYQTEIGTAAESRVPLAAPSSDDDKKD